MSDRQLMQQAMKAMLNSPNDISNEMFESIRALRARLAQPEQEPVAHCEAGPEHCPVCLKELSSAQQKPAAEVKLMMTGANAGIATRIVEIDDPTRERLRPGQKLYTNPPQRNPPTDEQERKHFEYWHPPTAFDYESHPIGSALALAKEKNT